MARSSHTSREGTHLRGSVHHLRDYARPLTPTPLRVSWRGHKFEGDLLQNLGWGDSLRDRVSKMTRGASSQAGDTCNCQDSRPAQRHPRGEGTLGQPRGCAVRAPRWRLQAAGPPAKRSLLPQDLAPEEGVLSRRSPSPGLRRRSRGRRRSGQPRHSAPPSLQYRTRCMGTATYRGRRGAPAEPRPGRAGGRGPGARAAGARPWARACGAAAPGAGRRALHQLTRAPGRDSAANASRSARAAEQRV